jgi:hypothetical protein
MSNLRCSVFTFLMLLSSIAAFGQGTPKKAVVATGSVTGLLTCADTNAPARFAEVTLGRVPLDSNKPLEQDKNESGADNTATTNLEGRFELDKVPVGRYYVLASIPGYLNPLALLDRDQLRAMSTETQKELAKLVPIVDVVEGQTATLTMRLEHASEVGGTVLYDDGSPAVGLHVQLLRKDKDGNFVEPNADVLEGIFSPFGANTTTDDRGHYRMIGTPAGEYTVRATLPMEMISAGGIVGSGEFNVSVSGHVDSGLSVYSGDKFRTKDAQITKVGDGEVVGGIDITVPLNGLHTISGIVTAKRDGHGLNKGRVELLDAEDLEQARSVDVEEDGSFVIAYVPEGKYILRVTGAGDTTMVEVHPYSSMTVNQAETIRSYGDAEMPLLVQGDINGVDLAAPDASAEKVAEK